MRARLPLLDVLRGVAILGTLGTNIWIFVTPGGLYGYLTADITGVAETAARFVTNGKFLSLLTILFGVGLAIQLDGARRRGDRWPGRYLWRVALLFADGVVHYLLVVEFDVLMGYAAAAFLVAYVVARSARVQYAVLAAAGGLHLVLMLAGTALLTTADLTTTTEDPLAARFTTASWPEQVLIRLENVLFGRAETIAIFPLTVFLFLLGFRLWRAGVFGADEAGRRLRRRLTRLGLGIGLPLNLATTLGGLQLILLDRYVVPPLVALGVLGLVGVLLDRRAGGGWVPARLGEVGRTALSAYMLQNVLASVIFYGWGLGLANRFGEDHRVLLAAVGWTVISALVVAGAHLWLRRFRQGPVEAVLRAAYEAPLRRRTPAVTVE